MRVTRKPARRVGITELPARAVVTLGGPVTAEGRAALLSMLSKPAPTFEALVAAAERWARSAVEGAGGVPVGSSLPAAAGLSVTEQAGYLVPDVAEGSAADFALRLLWLLPFARSTDPEQARCHAFQFGALAAEASMKFKWELLTLRGERELATRQSQGRESTRKRERGRAGWKERARRMDSTMDEPDSRKERAYLIAKRLGVSWRSVYDVLPRRSRSQSSR